jgi:serine/threonine protein kinase
LTAGDTAWVEAASFVEQRSRPALRRAIEQLKTVSEAGRDTVGPAASTAPTLQFLRPPVKADQLGRLGQYEILTEIGRGGMGVVLKAFDPALQRLTAIKVLAPQWATHDQARQRFEREARAAALVRHENVVAIHAVEEADGLPYLVMEYVPGKSLQQRLDQDGPFEIEDILRIGAQVAAGLAAAHERDLIHRDIKPANILLDKSGNVRLTDFGLARAVDDTSLTQTGVIAGTPQYMAPEQARGTALDHRADLFSLGSVLYAMCTGRAPFRAPTTIAVLKRVCDDQAKDVRDGNPDVPDYLAEIIDKLHAKKRRDRFQTADEVARLLTQHLQHLQLPRTFAPPRPLSRSRTAKSRGLWAAVLAMPAAAVLALMIWGAIHYLSPKPVVDHATQPVYQAPKADEDPYFQSVRADLDSRDYFTRKTALERLVTMKPNDQRADIARKLVELTASDEVFHRRLAVAALGMWGSKDEIPALLRAMAHKDPMTRGEALKVIGRFRDPKTIPAVIQGFRENSTRADAGQALRQLGTMAEPDVRALLTEDNVFLKRDAILVLKDIGTDASAPAIQETLAKAGIQRIHLEDAAQQAIAAIEQRKKK